MRKFSFSMHRRLDTFDYAYRRRFCLVRYGPGYRVQFPQCSKTTFRIMYRDYTIAQLLNVYPNRFHGLDNITEC